MSINTDRIYEVLLNWGLVILALGVTFSLTLMSTSVMLLLAAFLILLFKKKIKFKPTGLEVPLLLFIGLYLLSALFGPQPLESIRHIANDYWYILIMYLVMYLFDSKEIDKFVKILAWAAMGVAIYTIGQSLVGLDFNLKFNIGRVIRVVAPQLIEAGEIFGHPIYFGTGIMGHHLIFAGQLMMLTLFTSVAFRKKWPTLLVFLALVLTFVYSAWFGFVAALVVFFGFNKKRRIFAVILVMLLGVLIVSSTGIRHNIKNNLTGQVGLMGTSLKMYGLKTVIGTGAGQSSELHREHTLRHPATAGRSIYLDIITEGGILTFLAFLFLLWKFLKLYAIPPPVGKWKSLHKAGVLALIAVMAAGVFGSYLTTPANSVLIWTIAGFVVRIKIIEDENKRFNIVYNT